MLAALSREGSEKAGTTKPKVTQCHCNNSVPATAQASPLLWYFSLFCKFTSMRSINYPLNGNKLTLEDAVLSCFYSSQVP